ncbi:PspC domain-containing protein [Sphingosinicella terrae]|jgi:phage shock protein C|uniref:PspC domain-containing protein n=1 Tax=Sphingosinicella terrae TaxID=2172047 RepID=UPI000E0D2B18|nr:PspC domain-containing protein [Sphingosinicella terrae]
MRVRRKKFELDRDQGKLLGVCAGLANHTGVDVTIIRIALVLVTLMGAFPWTLVAYGAAAFVAHRQAAPRSRYDRIALSDEGRERSRALELRMQAIETHAASANSRLAREIEALR